MLLQVQVVSRELRVGLEAPKRWLLGFETAALETERDLRPERFGLSAP